MNFIAPLLVGFVALQHIGFLVLEMFVWTTPTGLKIFRMTPEQAEQTAALAKNQGLYNGFLAAGLIWGLILAKQGAEHGTDVQIFFVACVVIAGIYGAITAAPNILFIQALPAALALGALLFLS